MAWMYCYKEVLPFTALVVVECTNVGLNILFKAASLKGMSKYVFIVYSYAIATLILLPLAFIFRSSAVLPTFKLPLILRICLLGIIGILAQICAYQGIEYSSPTLASAISNLTPAFTFSLAIIFRMEKLALRNSSTRAKIIGTIVSISGALVVVLYKGPTILSNSSQVRYAAVHRPLGSSQSQWIIGGLLLATEYLLVSIWYIIQTQVMKIYPAEFIVVFFCNLCGTIISAPLCLIVETKWSAWRLRPDVSLAAVIYSGFLGSSFSTVVHTWGLHLKGPVYVVIFKPLSIVIAAVMSFIFLGDALYLGSVIGAIIISVGFYVVIWGKAKENQECDPSSLEASPNAKIPLLQGNEVEEGAS